MPDDAKCEGCGRAIKWVLSKNGKPLPVDARAVTGHLYVVAGAKVEPLAGYVPDHLPGEYTDEPKVYVSHFLTCPQASRFGGGRA